MATLQVREKINQLIRFTALAMLVLGLLVTIAPFKIHYHNKEINFDESYEYWGNHRANCEINIPKIYDQYWSGFTIILTSLITLVTYHAKIPKWPPRVKLVSHQREICAVAVLLSMISSLAVMSQEEGPFGRVRHFNDNYRCYEDHHKDSYYNNRYHRSKMLSWFYVLLISSNILVVGCVLQSMAFFSVWILNVLECSDPEENHSQQQQQQQQQQWYLPDEEEQLDHAMQPLLTTQSTNESYPHTSTNQHHTCNCTVVKPHLPTAAERPDSLPPAYTTGQSEGDVNGLSPHSEYPQGYPNQAIALSPSN